MNILQKIRNHLEDAGIDFKEVHHAATYTSEESAKARGEALSTGGKALVLKVDKAFKLFVMSASRKLDSGALKKQLGIKKVRFATKEELMELTGLVPGCVPPFGEPILNLELFVDESITKNEKIAFNAGSLTDSIVMTTPDYLKLVQATILSFSK